MKYVPPLTKDGKIQHVPIVVKNRDFLIGVIETTRDMIDSIADLIEMSDEEVLTRLSPNLDSSRFNNYIDDGIDCTKITEEEKNKIYNDRITSITEHENSHPENKNDVLQDEFFTVECNCGYSVGFRTMKEIPSETFKCELCDRTLIHYIHVEDEDIEFDEGKD